MSHPDPPRARHPARPRRPARPRTPAADQVTTHPPPARPRTPTAERLAAVLTAAAFHGSPRDALPALAGLDPADPLPARTRWLAGVCLGALGRYRTAERWLRAGRPSRQHRTRSR